MYNDIVHLPHPVSTSRTPMPRASRAAQFAPFAALTGYEDAVDETARVTARRIETDDTVREELDRRWRCICEHADEETAVTVTYFRKDDKKDGGAYLTVTGTIQKIDKYRGCFYMNDGTSIAFVDVLSIESDVLYRVAGDGE